jgi:hypothetical protein
MKKSEGLPYIIHACCHAYNSFPTHTHGLTEIELPEFIVDPLAFGPQGNARLINASYRYLSMPENAEILNSIMSGENITINSNTLDPSYDGTHNFCFRRVGIDFEGVKQAYDGLDLGKIEDVISFIQIYIEGDDFALDDDYYKDGVTW